MINTELLKKLTILYEEALRYETSISKDESRGLATDGVAKPTKTLGMDKKFVNPQDLRELLFYVSTGRAHTMEEAINLFVKNHNQ